MFNPSEIYVESSAGDYPLTRRILEAFPSTPIHTVDSVNEIKIPRLITPAKRELFITRHKGDPIKSCQGMGDYVCCNYFTVSFVSNCHFECTYCILQDYLKDNPIMTLYANVEEILEAIEARIKQSAELVRLGTGELSDSLALDDITQLSKTLVPFAARQKNLVLELKTKSDCVGNLLDLDHGGKTVISWSVNPQAFVDTEELKCASLEERLTAARLVADAGYPIGFHFDPLLVLPGWEDEYRRLVDRIRGEFEPDEIAWISMGSLRFTPGLKKTIQHRFPKSRLLEGELFPAGDGKVRYFREIREELYAHVKALMDAAFPTVPNYLCMETKKVWGNVTGMAPPSQRKLEAHLAQRFAI